MRSISAVCLAVFLAAGLGADPKVELSLTEFRRAAGLSVPGLSSEFSAACAARARDLAEAGVLSHVDAQGRGPGVQMLSHGLPPGEYGEILGSGASWDAVWAAWQASQTHRQVLVSGGWTRWGWGSHTRGNTVVWVVRFYRP